MRPREEDERVLENRRVKVSELSLVFNIAYFKIDTHFILLATWKVLLLQNNLLCLFLLLLLHMSPPVYNSLVMFSQFIVCRIYILYLIDYSN